MNKPPKPTVLMIDDDLVANFIVERKLKQQGLVSNLQFVENGEDALQWIEENYFPTIILLDLSMPIMSGIEFLDEWESKGYKGKSSIWVLTASLTHDQKVQLKQYEDVKGLFEKPLNQMNIDILVSKLTN